MSDKVVYASKVRIERIKGPFRRAYLPVETEPIHFGVHEPHARRSMWDTDEHGLTRRKPIGTASVIR